jgi:hypothetical protein
MEGGTAPRRASASTPILHNRYRLASQKELTRQNRRMRFAIGVGQVYNRGTDFDGTLGNLPHRAASDGDRQDTGLATTSDGGFKLALQAA